MGLGPGLKRFIGGFANATLDSIQKREAYDRDLQKAKMLEELRTSQAKELADYQELLNRKKVDPKLVTEDFKSKSRTLRNEYGEEIGSMPITDSEVESHDFDGTLTGLTIPERANEIKYRQKDIVDSLRDSGVPAEEIQKALLDSVRQAAARGLPPSKAEEIFISATPKIREIWLRSKGNTRRTAKALDELGTNDGK